MEFIIIIIIQESIDLKRPVKSKEPLVWDTEDGNIIVTNTTSNLDQVNLNAKFLSEI